MEWKPRIKLIFIFIFIINGNLLAQDIEQYFVSDSIACDTFPPPRNLDGYTQDDAARIWWEPPLIMDSLKIQANISINPQVKTTKVYDYYKRDIWDVQAVFPCGDATGEAGIETDGNYIYTTKWNAGSGTFFEYEMDGTFNGSFTVSGGCMDVRDLAYNDYDMLFYGSNADSTVWGMNFATGSVDNTINAPVACRAIAFDPNNLGFWANNWSNAITLFDMSGATITSFPVGTFGNYYGFAYDNWTNPGTPYLWGHSQDGSGCKLVQMDINAGGTEIFNMDLTPIIGGNNLAGGLYTHCAAYEVNKVTIGGIRQDDFIYALELTSCTGTGPPSFIVPQNLLGYNLYRDNELLDYIEYDGSDTTFYWDFNITLPPGCIDYEVTAIYDHTLCGFPGDSIESEGSGVITICVGYYFILPFVEEWNTGSFDPNLWTHEEPWIVNGDFGNPLPTALFDGSEIDSSYSNRLTSYWIDCKYHPGTEDLYIDGDFYLEFDIALNDLDTCGIDRMMVQYTDTISQYQNLMTFSDSMGSFPWEHHKINITSEVKGELFRLAFLANGEDGSIININNWYIDNITVYRECNPPRELQWIVYDEIFAWQPPIPHITTKDGNAKGFQGYDIYGKEGGYEFLAFTTDTFYIPNQSYEAYYVTAVYEDCESASNELLGPMEVMENDHPTDIKIYPNPASNQITIEAESNISSVRLIDINGRILISVEPENKKSQLNTSALKNGVYLIETDIGSGFSRRKIIIHH